MIHKDFPSNFLTKQLLISPMKTYRGIGLMSGTSLDGIDLAFCSFSEDPEGVWNWEFLETTTVPYSAEWRERLANLQSASAENYARTDVEYGHLLGTALANFISVNKLNPGFVASHGQTIFHQPERKFTAQIGDGETIASYLPCPVVTNFRAKDVALGGQGAPLVPFGEQLLFPDCSLFLNLGGFANIAADGIAFDISPCNFVLNSIAKTIDPSLEFDPNGDLARSGTCSRSLLEKLDALPYYDAPPPKSLGREWVEKHFLPVLQEEKNLSAPDILCTVCHHIASQISRAISAIGIQNTQILITGGGFRNRFLTELLENRLKPLKIELHPNNSEALVDYKEALIFAFLGLHTLLGHPNILRQATGASRASVGGSIHLPGNASGTELSIRFPPAGP